jgi:hypothetical protein
VLLRLEVLDLHSRLEFLRLRRLELRHLRPRLAIALKRQLHTAGNKIMWGR